MEYLEIEESDRELIEAATEVIRRNYREGRHGVGCAVRAASGRVFVGVNIEAPGYGPCAEHVALGAAFSNGETEMQTIVAVSGWREGNPVIPPCGTCRQLLIDYCPDAFVILPRKGKPVRARARDLLPLAFCLFDEAGTLQAE